MNILLTSGFLCLFLVQSGIGQSYRSTVNEGNDLYHQQQYDRAKSKYKTASSADPERLESEFNIGNTEYRTDNFKAAIDSYKKAGERATSREEGAQIWYNAGNTFLNAAEKDSQVPMQQQGSGQSGGDLRMEGYKQAIQAYKESLKLNPKDEDTRYNLTYAMKKLQDLKNQDKKNEDKKDKKQDKKKDQKDKDKDKKKQDQEQKQDQKKDQKQEQKQDQKQEQQRKPQEKKMSKQQAEQILKALERDEKALQKKKKAKRVSRINVEKDW